MKPIVYADNGSWKVHMNTLVGQIDKMFAFMETQTSFGIEQHKQLHTTPMQKVYFSTLLALCPRFLPLLHCYLYSFLFKISLLSSILKSKIGTCDLQ